MPQSPLSTKGAYMYTTDIRFMRYCIVIAIPRTNIRPGGGRPRPVPLLQYCTARALVPGRSTGPLRRICARRRKVGVAFFSARFQEYCCKMAEFVTCSQDSVVFWDNKSFSSKKSSQPFSGSGYHVASAFWSSSSIQNCYTIVYTLSVRVRGHNYLWLVVEYYIS